MTGEYAAFISYRHRPLDTTVATRLHRLIEHYRVPKDLRQDGEKHVGRVFRDRDELPLSSDLTAELREALDHSKFLIVICTPDTPQSLWVDREIEYFLRSHDRDNVLAVLAAGTQDVSFPKRLTEVYAEDGVTVVEQVEPLAANIADETNPVTLANRLLPHNLRVLWRLHKEFLRLMAALLHCPYDTLRQRARQYFLQQVLAFVLVAAAVIAVFAGMLLNRNREIARQMALAQQNEQRALAGEALAQENEQRALTNEAEAQKNESYVLGLLSAQQMANGDRFTAIETALAGLPGEGETRSTHTAAEQALADALYQYQPAALQAGGIVRIDYDIRAAYLNGDGSRLITLEDDSYTVRCYDTANARLLWSTPHGDLIWGTFTAFVPWQDGQEAFLHTFFNEVEEVEDVELLDMNTGEVLADWDVGDPAEDYGSTCGWGVLPDGRTLAAVYESFSGAKDLLLVTWDLWTGERQDTLTLPLPYGRYLNYTQWQFLFDEDGTHWALLVRDRDSPNRCGWQAAYAGRLDGLTLTWQQQYPDLNLTNENSLCGLFDEPGELVLVHTDGTDAGGLLWVDRFDVDDGTQEYSSAGTLPWDYSSTDEPILFGLNRANALLFLGTGVCHIDTSNGDLRPQPLLEDAALCAYPDGDGGFFVVQENGMIAQVPKLVWEKYDCEVLYSSAPALRAATAAGESAAFALLPWELDDRKLEDLRAVWLYRMQGDDDYRLLPMPAPDKTYLVNPALFPLEPDGRLAVVETTWDSGSFFNSIYLYDKALQTVQTFSFPDDTLPRDVRPRGLTEDGLLLCTTKTDTDGIWLDTASGQLYTLADLLPEVERMARRLAMPDGGEKTWFAWLTFVQHLDDSWPQNKLGYAFSPRQAQEAPLPDGIILDGVLLNGRQLAVGGNGWAVTSGYTPTDGSEFWAAFDTAAGQWQTVVKLEADYSPNLCVGDTRPCFATLEEDGTCRLYDLAKGTSRVLAHLPGSEDEPAQPVLRFADADRVLLAFLPDGTLYILDIETGAVRLTVDLPALPDTYDPLVQTDEADHDLYITDRSGELPGLCIDLDDDCVQGQWDDLLCYLPASRELAFANAERSEGYAPRLFPVLDASALAARARALLAP